MVTTKKLEKIHDRLYHESHKEGRPFKWEKELRSVSVEFTEIRTALILDITRSETAFRLFREESSDKSEREETAEQCSRQEQDKCEQYSQTFNRKISGKGHFDGDEIGLIKKDGTLSDRAELFESADVILRSVANSEKEKASGLIFYNDARSEKKRSAPYIILELFVPEVEFDKIWEELVSGRLSQLDLLVYVDTFESEVNSALREPDMDKTLYIEEGELFSRAYLSWLRASRSTGGETSGAPKDPNDLFEAEGFHEQKINYFGKWLMGIGISFNSAANVVKGLYNALVFWIAGYLIYKVLGWLFHWPS